MDWINLVVGSYEHGKELLWPIEVGKFLSNLATPASQERLSSLEFVSIYFKKGQGTTCMPEPSIYMIQIFPCILNFRKECFVSELRNLV
jgi:hypothetical protein